MIRKSVGMAALALSLLAGSAFAQSGAEYEDETEFTFEGSVVEGQLMRPDQETISGQVREGGSLIRLRLDFIPEMVRSVEEL